MSAMSLTIIKHYSARFRQNKHLQQLSKPNLMMAIIYPSLQMKTLQALNRWTSVSSFMSTFLTEIQKREGWLCEQQDLCDDFAAGNNSHPHLCSKTYLLNHCKYYATNTKGLSSADSLKLILDLIHLTSNKSGDCPNSISEPLKNAFKFAKNTKL